MADEKLREGLVKKFKFENFKSELQHEATKTVYEGTRASSQNFKNDFFDLVVQWSFVTRMSAGPKSYCEVFARKRPLHHVLFVYLVCFCLV